MTPLVELVVAAAATITATAAVTAAGFTAAIYRAVKRHERALFGEESIEDWPGIVQKVTQHRKVLKREGLL
ncbi:hypothetical protein [Haloparvum sedimenti]|uniref:hypothetical protein n=1 Tax=Haloparvum sedimenti TaxID=1678448 RepID=UPI00071E91D4|nr:hypothetical protein [Haloparvum sedimenti]